MRTVALGFACNNACIFCAQGELRTLGGAEATPAAELVDAITPGETVAFVGGEPTLSDRLLDFIRLAEARGAGRILVQTNGRRLAYRAYAHALREASARLSLDVSLHGSTARMHDYHTSVAGSFGQTVLGLRHARAEGIGTAVTTVITRSNFRHLVEIVGVSHSSGALAVHFRPAEHLGRAACAPDRVLPPMDMVMPHLSRALAEADRLGMGFWVGGKLSRPDVRALFAGLGEVETPDHATARHPLKWTVGPGRSDRAPDFVPQESITARVRSGAVQELER
jgi:MoaA/NifB/PqqE/SkfB family radical SAM enzyme